MLRPPIFSMISDVGKGTMFDAGLYNPTQDEM
jgi:hypothetical protein